MLTLRPAPALAPPPLEPPRAPDPATDQPSLFDREPEPAPVPVQSSTPQVAAAARAMAVALMEVLQGRRHPDQLLRWAEDEVRLALLQHARYRRRRRLPAPHLASLRVQDVTGADGVVGAAEVTARVFDGLRSSACAFRMERRQGRWLCVCVEFGAR